MGRRRLLTDDQATELRLRYALYRANKPEVLAKTYGIPVRTITDYVIDGERERKKLRGIKS